MNLLVDRRKSGVVLVIVLAALALIAILLLALFQGASHQMRGAQSAAAVAREKMLADSAVALVIGQIQQASTQPGQAWISQPGLLRTYAADASRKPTACYKLYSAASMTDTGGTLAFMAADVPANWNSEPDQYTDLNAPAQTPGGQSIYPILDPAAITGVTGVSTDTGAVTMPVAWLYQLQDGTLGPASNGTAANPIVARIAFWTDDDTCKININTAGSGSPWNTPRASSPDDAAWSATPPAQGEFSRYPGHPATTALDVVFGSGANPLSPQQLLGLTPRYAWGGSEAGAQPTTAGETVPPKTDRLYASLDELCFSSGLTGSGQRQPNPIASAPSVAARTLDAARFVLTAHSQAPETTLLGEPRIAIWPVSDAPQDATRTTATDRAVQTDATVGAGTASARNYFFERHNAQSATDDLNPALVPGNAQLFGDLVARGNLNLPGYGTTLSAKYPGANWTQIVLEITDFIRGLNAVDPGPAPFVPYAAGDATGLGRGFIVPLTTAYGSGASQVTLRGLGRCPTLSSLTLVFYVCGFEFNNDSSDIVDYDLTPDDAAGTNWNRNFDPQSPVNRWSQVTHELVRAFVVPCTFQPGCAYPEVSDACDIQIAGLDGMTMTSARANDFDFTSPVNSSLLGNPLRVLSADRAWGGNEGPITWRAAGDALASGNAMNYPFAGGKCFAVPLSSPPQVDAETGRLSWPSMPTFAFGGVTGLTVHIRDSNGNTLQTLSVDLPAFTARAPTIRGECDHMDGATPNTSHSDWATNAAYRVKPSYYMSLNHRLLATQLSRAAFIQAGDISRSVEADTDLRVIAALATVPSSMFHPHPDYAPSPAQPEINVMGGSHAHNLRFADGTSACFAPDVTAADPTTTPSANTRLVASAAYPKTALPLITVTDWGDGTTPIPYDVFTQPPCSAPTGSSFVTMMPVQNVDGDWDTGPGAASDGAQINLPDSGTTLAPAAAYSSLTGGQIGAATQRTPNALVPSPVIFGSLPAGINPAQPALSEPWRTLLFCPYPAADTAHPGFASPPDYLVLDNFWMPVVEPYAIGTRMATDGKINLNDQIAPFTYLHRNTAFHALLHDLRLPAISVATAGLYKSYDASGPAIATTIWKSVDENATIAQMENRFAGNSVDAYLTEGEICSVPLVPQGQASTSVAATQTALDSFWNGFLAAGGLTGDNLRELPYAQLYGRLTTRSNSYTVHVRVQVLKKLPGDPNQNKWDEGVDLVQGEWRGSYEIERYLDPAATAPVAGQPLGPYKFRIVSARRFAP